MRPEAACGKIRCQAIMERELRARGFHGVAGVDEVGRGALFGPVVAAAVILSPDRPIRGLNDSKLLEPERRETLAVRIRDRAVAWAVAAVDAATIDSINIYQASRQAMRMAAGRLSPAPDFLLVDAVSLDMDLPQRALIKGDARCHAIAAASIVAKVWRDELMRVWDAVFPAYGLASHKGYCTPEHLRALREFGPTPLHRLSFEPVRAHARILFDGDLQMELFETAAAV
jgi:ribonuclease HII